MANGTEQPDPGLSRLGAGRGHVVYHPHAVAEIEAGLFEGKVLELVCFLELLRNLGRWPPKPSHAAMVAGDLEIRSIEHDGKAFFATTVERAGATDRRGVPAEPEVITVYFWMNASGGPVWVLHALSETWLERTFGGTVRKRVVRRLRDVEGHAQDHGARP
ncbi:MAG: hypothetical protein ACKVS8_01475 [Phycisphaerales bacterium]